MVQAMTDMRIDFNDLNSVADAIPRARSLIRQAERRRDAARDESERARERASAAEIEMHRWNTLLITLESLAQAQEDPFAPGNEADERSSTELALSVVITINGPTNIAEVAEHMPAFNRKTVGWALWKLAEEGVIQKLGHGRYAPLSYRPGQPTTNYYAAANLGMPTLGSAQIEQAVVEARAIARDKP